MFNLIGGILIGLLIGCLFTHWLLHPKLLGDLLIDRSEGEPYLFVEMAVHPNNISDGEIIAFKVVYKNFLEAKENSHN